jgi:hypothetical protein
VGGYKEAGENSECSIKGYLLLKPPFVLKVNVEIKFKLAGI